VVDLAAEYGWSKTHLCRVLKHRSGPILTRRFKHEALNIDETISILMPELLDEKVRQRLIERFELNKHHTHRTNVKHKYLLAPNGRYACSR
jgi:hypothetical protein